MLPGSHLRPCDWNSDGTTDEDFVIAPDRTIWHSWRTSGRWVEMPNNGRADDTVGCHVISGNRVIDVFVASSKSTWRSLLDLLSGHWLGWYEVAVQT